MKNFLKHFAVGFPLAGGAVFTLVAVSMIVQSSNPAVILGGCVLGFVGIPLLYATIASLLEDRGAI